MTAGCDRIGHMLRTIILFAICAAAVSAQDEAEYTAWMKSIPPQVNTIKADIMAKDNGKVSVDANKLAETFQETSDFWMKRQKEDAVKMAQEARDAAKEIGEAKTEEAQNAAVMKLQGTCGACHRAYREGKPGAFKIKS